YLATAVIGVKGTNLTSWPESSRVPGYPRANTLQEDSLADSLERDASGPGRRSAAGTAGRRPQAWNRCAGIADPARPAGQLAARPGRPDRCARRSDRRGSSILRFRAPAVRAARADRRVAALAAAAALTCPVRTATGPLPTAMEPEQLPGRT